MVGDQVSAKTTEGWRPGTVVQVYYREPNWPPGKVAPYQIKLDSGGLIYAHVDTDELVRLPVPTALTELRSMLENYYWNFKVALLDSSFAGLLDPANWLGDTNGSLAMSSYMYAKPLVAVVLGLAVWQRLPYVENSDVRRLLFASLVLLVSGTGMKVGWHIQRFVLYTAGIID